MFIFVVSYKSICMILFFDVKYILNNVEGCSCVRRYLVVFEIVYNFLYIFYIFVYKFLCGLIIFGVKKKIINKCMENEMVIGCC